MATNESRSLNQSAKEGATDGKYRKVRPNTTVAPGMGDELTRKDRKDLHPYWNYGYITNEIADQVDPLSKNDSVYDNEMGANY